MQQICDDLEAEQAALDAIVADLTEEQWRTPTPAAGWDVADTIVHIVQADLAGLQAVEDRRVRASSRPVSPGATAEFDQRLRAPGRPQRRRGPRVVAGQPGPDAHGLPGARAQGPGPLVRAVDERAVLRHRPPDGDVGARPGRGPHPGPADRADRPAAPRLPHRDHDPGLVVCEPGRGGPGRRRSTSSWWRPPAPAGRGDRTMRPTASPGPRWTSASSSPSAACSRRHGAALHWRGGRRLDATGAGVRRRPDRHRQRAGRPALTACPDQPAPDGYGSGSADALTERGRRTPGVDPVAVVHQMPGRHDQRVRLAAAGAAPPTHRRARPRCGPARRSPAPPPRGPRGGGPRPGRLRAP